MDVTSAFQGITTPVQTLLDQIHRRGWQVTKVDYQQGDNGFKATAKNPYGQQVEKVGPDQGTALAALLTWIIRHEYTHTQARMASFADTFTHKMEEVAEEYAKAPAFDHKAAAAWKELADDCVARAAILQKEVGLEITNEPEPYKNVQELVEDVRKNKKIKVSRAGASHPVWTQQQVIAFRYCHDILGHAAAGAGFNWHGENLATAAHLPWLTENAQKALFTETLGQSAYMAFYRAYGPQKIAFLDVFKDAQESENQPGHSGVHPNQTRAPGVMPKTAGIRLDPNANYDAGTPQLPDAAYLWQGDPLEAGKVQDTARKIDTGWQNFVTPEGKPDWTRIEQAVVNAFRVVLLSPRKDLKWNAVHYQDLSSVPATVSDPKVYWDTLENARTSWNTARGWHPDSHKAYFRELKDFYKWYAIHHPDMTPQEVKEHADREVYNMRVEIEERIEQEFDGDIGQQVIEPKVNAELQKRLKTVINPSTNKTMDEPDYQQMAMARTAAQLDMAGNIGDDRYGAFMGSHLKQIAQVSSYAPEIARAAYDDVASYKGTGHHFRQYVLSLGIPGVGPKVCSFAWLMLAPMKSQLATIDVHMMDVLGRNYEKDMNNRDYFKFERELQAGRDAAGYAHVPLGQFQWGMWDYKRTPGQHQDHSAMRVINPEPHHNIDWAQKGQVLRGDEKWPAPYWWDSTSADRQRAGQEFDQTLGKENTQTSIPWQEEEVPVHAVVSSQQSSEELCVALDIPEGIRQRIWNYAQLLGYTKRELIPIEEYHITVAYGDEGYNEPLVHDLVRQHNISGMKFKAVGLECFGTNARVLRLDSPQWKPWANFFLKKLKEQGIEVSEFDGGPKAHVTIAYSEKEPNEVPKLQLDFRAGALHLMRPRGLPVPEPIFHHSTWTEIGGPNDPLLNNAVPAPQLPKALLKLDMVICPQCNVEHDPEMPCPQDNYDQMKRHWYDQMARSPEAPGDTNPSDPVGDLRNLGRTAALTNTQLLRKQQMWNQTLGPDQATIDHRFPDGWSIRKLDTHHAECYEGEMMPNCVGSADALLNRMPQERWHEPTQVGNRVDNWHMYSVRDPNNVPHATFSWSPAMNNFRSMELEGRAGSNAGKYAPYVHDWWLNKGGAPMHPQDWEDEFETEGPVSVGSPEHQNEDSEYSDWNNRRPEPWWDRKNDYGGMPERFHRAAKWHQKAMDMEDPQAEEFLRSKLANNYKPEEIEKLVEDFHQHRGQLHNWEQKRSPDAVKPPEVQAEMQQALAAQGHPPEAIPHMMRQVFRYDPQTQQMENLERMDQPTKPVDPTLDQPGDMTLPEHWSKTAGLTTPQYKKWIAELEAKHGPDKSKTVHQWPDGWSVVTPQRQKDVMRYGTLLGNCWQNGGNGNGGHVLLDQHGVPRGAWNVSAAHMMNPRGYGATRFGFDYQHPWMESYPSTKSPSGRANAPLKPEYMSRVLDWAAAQPLQPMMWRYTGDDSNYGRNAYEPVPVTEGMALPRTAAWHDEWEPSHDLLEQASRIDPWSRGYHGKGLIMPDGTMHTWSTNELGDPHHDHVAMEKNLLDYGAKVDIAPNGAAYVGNDEDALYGMSREQAEAMLQQEAPRHGLHPAPSYLASVKRKAGVGIEAKSSANAVWTDLADGNAVGGAGEPADWFTLASGSTASGGSADLWTSVDVDHDHSLAGQGNKGNGPITHKKRGRVRTWLGI